MIFLRQAFLLFLFVFTAQTQTLNWVFVSATGIPKPSTDPSAKPLYLYLSTAGDIYLDDVSVVAGSTTNGVNLVTNGGFEGKLSPWTIGTTGNNSASVVTNTFAHSGTQQFAFDRFGGRHDSKFLDLAGFQFVDSDERHLHVEFLVSAKHQRWSADRPFFRQRHFDHEQSRADSDTQHQSTCLVLNAHSSRRRNGE